MGTHLSDPESPFRGPPNTNRLRRERFYRERAREIRELAVRTPYAEVRQDLVALSLRYEHLADRAKAIAEKAPNWSHPSNDQDDPLFKGESELPD